MSNHTGESGAKGCQEAAKKAMPCRAFVISTASLLPANLAKRVGTRTSCRRTLLLALLLFCHSTLAYFRKKFRQIDFSFVVLV